MSASIEGVRGVYVCAGGQRGERGVGGQSGGCWPLSKQFQIRLAPLPPKKDGEFHDDFETVQLPLGDFDKGDGAEFWGK